VNINGGSEFTHTHRFVLHNQVQQLAKDATLKGAKPKRSSFPDSFSRLKKDILVRISGTKSSTHLICHVFLSHHPFRSHHRSFLPPASSPNSPPSLHRATDRAQKYKSTEIQTRRERERESQVHLWSSL
jgi:hypothetical protein